MNKIQMGIYEKALRFNGNIEETLNRVAETGYDFIELALDKDRLTRFHWTDLQKIEWQQASLNSGIGIYNLVLSAHRDFPFGSDNAEIRKKAFSIMEQAIEFSVDMGIRTIQIAGYYTMECEETTVDSKRRFIEGMHISAELASRAGVMLGIENVDRDIISIGQIKEIINIVNSPWLKIYPDIGNLYAKNLNVKEEISKNINDVVGFHLKDSRERVFRRVPYGEGIVDFKAFFEILNVLNYKGPFGLEMWNDNNENSFEIVKEARTWMLKQLVLPVSN